MNIQLFNYSVNVLQALLWQYNTAPNLTALITAQQTWFTENQTDFWENWFTNVFDLTTANIFGLAVWAIILNIPITDAPPNPQPFGFGPIGNGYFNFSNGTFASSDPLSGLTVEEKRFVLRLRYFQLTCRGAIPEINAFMAAVIPTITGGGTVYVLDNLDMTISYVFTFTPSPRLLGIIELYDILPRPAGVSVTVVTPP